MAEGKKYLTGSAAKSVWDWILSEGIKRHVDTIAPIIISGDVAVCLLQAQEDTHDLARMLGWDGSADCFRMTSGGRKRFEASMRQIGDAVTADWLYGRRTDRIFVIVEKATFLVNYRQNEGYSLEPGSTDQAASEEFARRARGGDDA